MEHLVLTPDLEATITSIDESLDGSDSFSGSEYELSIDVKIVNADYWQPDYTVRNVQQIGIGTLAGTSSRTISYAVRNIGPAKMSGRVGLQSNTHVLDAQNTSVYSEPTSNLDPGREQVYQVSLAVDECELVRNTISADHGDRIDEFEESNNIASVRLHPITRVGFCPEVDDKQDYEAEFGWIEQNGFDVMGYKFEGLNRVEWGVERGNNPIAENAGGGAPIFDPLEADPR